ncbi:MAG: DUF4382 domain-containing protein [Nitrospirota bacterium]
MSNVSAEKNKFPAFTHIAVLSLFFITLSCGGGTGPDPQPGSGKGTVALFITDNISFYKQVVMTITGIRLVNSGTGDMCEVLSDPVTLDIANLTNLAHYVNLTECPDGRYNKINIDFQKSTHLMDQRDSASACSFTSYLNEAGEKKALACDQDSGICSFSIRGGVRDTAITVQEDRYNDLGIDFNLKEFTAENFGDPASCSVTMKAATVSAVDMNSSGRSHEVAGRIQDLSAAAHTFTLLTGGVSLTVDYSGINPALQKNIDVLLQTAQNDSYPLIVQTGDIAIETGTIEANRIFMKAAGTVSNVDPGWSFTLTDPSLKSMEGSYKPPAVIAGAPLANGAWVNVRFDGYDAAKLEFVAASIEVLPAGTVIDD